MFPCFLQANEAKAKNLAMTLHNYPSLRSVVLAGLGACDFRRPQVTLRLHTVNKVLSLQDNYICENPPNLRYLRAYETAISII
jgi:hypothetical protein